MTCCGHCESGKDLWLQEEAALQTQSFRDAEPQLVIPPKTKKIMESLPGNSCRKGNMPFFPVKSENPGYTIIAECFSIWVSC